jgi:plastocyanin
MQLKNSLLGSLALVGLAVAATHDIFVGKEGLSFSPDTTTAAVGDSLVFHFYPGHTVAQGSFDSPCNPQSGGFFSGSISATSSGEASEKFVVKVNNTDPMWIYCTTPGHCQAGMVGVINPA